MNTCKTLYIFVLLIAVSLAHYGGRGRYTRGANVNLYQSDFVNGTYRILESGEYHIREDINFGPNEENDFWNDPRDRYYPIANYFMGFFAAITIEVDNVELYFHGHTVQQTEEFYLLQRFFNVIQLNDKVFVHNEGVGALNYQNRDNVTYVQTQTVGDLVTVSNVRIQGGTIGRNSHIGIHGNGASRLTIKNMVIEGFEVAGIQCNGCKRVVIDRCTVGPSARQVPVLATFSNARFMDLFVNRIIPSGFSRDGDFTPALQALLEEEITFADRDTPVTIQDTFTRLSEAVLLFRQFRKNTLPASLTADQEDLLQEAKRVFSNPSGLPDGGVLYGIVLNKLGVPHSDDNFYGSGYESGSIVVQNTDIKGLHARPTQVPALKTVGGDFIQGTSRDVFRIFDVVSDQFRTLTGSTYKGDFLSDVYFSMWKLSNSFYRTRVYDSECGNFGTNATMPYDILPAHANQCLGGINRDPTLTGRKVTLFNKRYFGGLVMSQGIYDWATTAGMSLDKILESPINAPELRTKKHFITCGADTMFHNMQGIIGLKILETNKVVLKNMNIYDIVNTGDASTWVCEQKWKLPQTGEVVMTDNFGINDMEGPHIRGAQVVLSDNIQFRRVKIFDLDSEEGDVFGIQIKDDLNDRTDYNNGRGITFEYSSINDLKSGGKSKAFDLAGSKVSPSRGLTIGSHEELHNGFKNPKTSIVLGYSHTVVPDFYGLPGAFSVENIPEFIAKVSHFTTPEKLLAFRNKAFKYFETYFGLFFSDYTNAALDDYIFVLDSEGNPTDAMMFWFAYDQKMKYHAVSYCDEDDCSELLTESLLIDVGFAVAGLYDGLEFHGTFAGDEGQKAPFGSSVFQGFYSFEKIVKDGVTHDNVVIEYFPVCPITGTGWSSASGTQLNNMINCELESDLFGKGQSTGAIANTRINATHWESNGYSVMVFDDIVDFPVESGIQTSFGNTTTYEFPTKLFTVWADGVLPNADHSYHLFPLVKNYHYTDESAIRYLLEQTSYDSLEKIGVLRKRFLTRLRDDFQVAGVNPDGFDDIPLDGVVDLGGGNRVQAYEVNDAANLRMMTSLNTADSQANTLAPGSRVREVGFRLVFGRAGRDTKYGHLPQGTVITEGVYILENTESVGSKIEMEFWSNQPLHSDYWSSTVIDNTVVSPQYGTGTVRLAVAVPKPVYNGKKLNIRGSIYFE